MLRAIVIETRIEILERENAELKQANASLLLLVKQQSATIKQLEGKIAELLKLVAKLQLKKDSHNSHNPPSQDKSRPKRNQSLREKSSKKSGGQKGHKGHTLKIRKNPDTIQELRSDYCSDCGEDLRQLEHRLISKRQVLDLPPITIHCTEYQQKGCDCPKCGHVQKATYPKGVKAPIQYGDRIISLIIYLNVFQYIPYQRLKQFFKEIFNHSISEGTIRNLLVKGAEKSIFIYDAILEQIKESIYVGADETGIKVNGTKWWIWVWQNVKNTYLVASDNRGFKTIQELFPYGLPKAIVGSDRWAAQLKTYTRGKQLCVPHLLRDLIYLIELEKSTWANDFKTLLLHSLQIRLKCEKEEKALSVEDESAKSVERQMDDLIIKCLDKSISPKTVTFQNAMLRHRAHIFTFLYNLEVPPDNNGSERAIRNSKVKLKVSGCFKTGQHAFCTLRSVFDTLRKRGLEPYNFFLNVLAT